MKKYFIHLIILLFVTAAGYAQTTRQVKGIVADTTGVTIPGAVVRLTSPTDTLNASTDINGAFSFGGVKAQKFSISFQSIGFEGLKRNYTFADNSPVANIGMIKLKTESKVLGVVNITDVNAVKLKEDTTEYKASAYPVRANANTEEVLKKLPGVDVDANGNVTAEGKQVTKVRINGKDFFGGDVQTATKNLPADVIESIQMIDDYGDQANLTGIKSGEPTKVMNIVIRKDKNYGYSLSGTAGDGEDALPKPATNDNRYTFQQTRSPLTAISKLPCWEALTTIIPTSSILVAVVVAAVLAAVAVVVVVTQHVAAVAARQQPVLQPQHKTV